MLSNDIAISVRNLTKTYRLFGHPGDRIKQFLSFGMRRYHHEFTALKDVSFEINKGDTVGIIGRNGSGKSTLLQLICGILKPTSGNVHVNGRVSALLELGAGFNPEFTGRENVYFHGVLMGFTQEQMEFRFEDIAAFADIGQFIDQPVRTYSSGMFLRLAFSVAIHVDPEILVVDEALAVGDFSFRNKCYSHIQRLTAGGMTLIFVSHELETLKLICDRTFHLENGQMRYNGDSGTACDAFEARERVLTQPPMPVEDGQSIPKPETKNLAEIVEVSFSSLGSESPTTVPYGTDIILVICYRVLRDLDSLTLAMHVRDERNLYILGTNTRLEGCDIVDPRSGDSGMLTFCFPNLLRSGDYWISVGLAADCEDHSFFPDWREKAVTFHSSAGQRWALVGPPVTITHQSNDRIL